jgi:hypothetical protein
MFKISWKLVIGLVIGLIFLILGASGFREGFKAGLPGRRCGVDLSMCPSGLQCMNGFCENPGENQS